jgi:uncharacterized protein with ATP-grasp and redox domains
MVGADEGVRLSVMREVSSILARADPSLSPPEVSDAVYRVIRKILAIDDPYREIKKDFNARARKMSPELIGRCREFAHDIEPYVRAALFGNVIDFGCNTPPDIEGAVSSMLTWELDGSVLAMLQKELESASSLLFLTDNCGEVVFDALLLAHIASTYNIPKIDVAVKGGPWINDAMEDDAIEAGICDIPGTSIVFISNGDEGTGWARSTKQFLDYCDAHDVVISKGQANWELLEHHPGIYFMLMVKCGEIGAKLGKSRGSVVVYKSC